jgi:HD-GYP domain-containing protein (c-di-GMP phosphodiesterase class II)
VDPAKYEQTDDERSEGAKTPPDAEPPCSSPQNQIVPEALITVIHDASLPPKDKAALVKQHSFDMMKSLFEQPTAESIREAKKGISQVVGLILKDDMTLYHLLNITSYDYCTYTHSVNVGILSVALAKAVFGIASHHDLQALGAGFFLHDLGKVSVDKDIVNKPGKLSDEEIEQMRKHPVLGFKLLQETKQLTEEAKTIVLQHHERADGKGYPKGLRGRDIHIYGKICAIADVYDALTIDRPYRKKMTPFDALRLMRNEMINHFQKDLFEQFVMIFRPPTAV